MPLSLFPVIPVATICQAFLSIAKPCQFVWKGPRIWAYIHVNFHGWTGVSTVCAVTVVGHCGIVDYTCNWQALDALYQLA